MKAEDLFFRIFELFEKKSWLLLYKTAAKKASLHFSLLVR